MRLGLSSLLFSTCIREKITMRGTDRHFYYWCVWLTLTLMCPYSKAFCFCKAHISCTGNYLRTLAQAFSLIGRNPPQSTGGLILQKAIMMGKFHLGMVPVIKRIFYFSLPQYSAFFILFFSFGKNDQFPPCDYWFELCQYTLFYSAFWFINL